MEKSNKEAVQCCQRRSQSPRPGSAIVGRRPFHAVVEGSPIIHHLCMCASKCVSDSVKCSDPMKRMDRDAVQ